MKGSVLLVGDNARAALQCARSLGRVGLDVHLVRFETGSVTKYSRYIGKTYHFGHPLTDTDRFVAGVLALIKEGSFDLVVPTSDKSLVPLMRVCDEIRQRAPFAAPGELGFIATQHKDRTIEIANRLGIRTPGTVVVNSGDSIPELSHLGRFPLVLKPSTSITLGRPKQNGVKVVTSMDELLQRVPEMLESCPVLVQEYCPGTGLGVGVLANQGHVFAAFQYRRVHEPPAGGPSTYRVSEPLSESLLGEARRFCYEIGWTGPAMFEYKVRPDNQEPVLMEVNGRMWGSIALPIQAGVDFPRLLYEMFVLNKTTETFEYRVPYFVRYTCRDIYWFQANLRAPSGRHDLIKVPLRQVLGELGNVLRLREGFDVESVSDPVPGVVGWWNLFRELAGDILTRVVRLAWKFVARRVVRKTRRGNRSIRRRLQASRSLLFVCTGNINRSAVAASRMNALLCGTGHLSRVASTGLVQRDGRSPCDISKDVAAALGVDISGHRSSILTPEMFDAFDTVVVMEAIHLQAVQQIRPSALQKALLLSGFDPSDDSVDIADPYGGDRAIFRDCYLRVIRCVDELHRFTMEDS